MPVVNGYCTVAEMEEWVSSLTAAHTSLIESLITGASRRIDDYCQRRFYLSAAGTERTFDLAPTMTGILRFPAPHEATVLTEVATDDQATGTYTAWAPGDWQAVTTETVEDDITPIVGLRLTGVRLWPVPQRGEPHGLVRVTGTWGWPRIPDAVRDACRLLVTRRFKRKDSPEGVVGFNAVGEIRVSRQMDPDIVDLLAPYRAEDTELMVAEYP